MATDENEDVGAYAVLGLDVPTVDVTELSARAISTAYRKKALKYHPDKNPGDATAVAALARVFRAHEALSDPERRKAIDAEILAQRARAVEYDALDGERRRLRDDLDSRERAAAKGASFSKPSSAASALTKEEDIRLREEIETLRRDMGREQGGADLPPKKTALGDTVARDDASLEPWSSVPGFDLFYSAKIDFEKLEAATLARACGEIPRLHDS